jgi:hypothetical protein
MGKKAEELEAEVKRLLAEAQAVDDAEDAKYGKDKRGDELPEELRFKQDRLKKIKEAMQSLQEKYGRKSRPCKKKVRNVKVRSLKSRVISLKLTRSVISLIRTPVS